MKERQGATSAEVDKRHGRHIGHEVGELAISRESFGQAVKRATFRKGPAM